MNPLQSQAELDALSGYSRGDLSAIDLRRRLGGATFGEVLMRLGENDIPLFVAPKEGREDRIALARSWLFPLGGHG